MENIGNFTEIFNDLQSVNTAIYGIGVITEEILHLYPDVQIAGLYDRDLKTGKKFGKKILDITNVQDDHIQRIVIAAGSASIKIIYERIEEICRKNNIQLVDIYNRDLYQVYGCAMLYDHPYFQIGKEELKRAIDLHDVISFDIFDTLIMRKTFEPHDVFRIVERKAHMQGVGIADFYSFRVQAEQNLIADIPNIYELYDELQRLSHISDSQKEILLNLELEVENELIVSRESICDMLVYAHSLNKKVYLVSDMHIPKVILEKWLAERKIVNYDEMFVSCEFHKPKVNGLYDIYRMNVEGNSFLHIGDHEIYDGVFAGRAGLDTFLIKSAVEMFRLSSVKYLENYMKTYSDRLMVGLFLIALFRNPFALYRSGGRVAVENLEQAVGVGAGPIISAFVMWFVEEIEKEDCGGVLLGARDGYLLCHLLDIYKRYHPRCELPSYLYFYTSRIACASSWMKSYEDFLQIVRRPKEKTLQACIEERMGFCIEEAGEKETYSKYQEQLQNVSDSLYRRYEQYIADSKIEKDKTYCFFDFVSSGTCLMLLQKRFGLRLKGKFFYRYYTGDQERAELEIDSFLDVREGTDFWEYYKIFETIMTSLEATFLRFDVSSNPVFEAEKRSEKELEITRGMQAAVADYFEQLQDMAVDCAVTKELVLEFARLLIGKRVCISDERKKLLCLYDSYEGGEIKVF